MKHVRNIRRADKWRRRAKVNRIFVGMEKERQPMNTYLSHRYRQYFGSYTRAIRGKLEKQGV